ncbi:porin [Roseovarius sp.]|uniref:porin n=1 Tax=Roseovarius sp. TaxID=1486281 RepID=UPI003A975A24
MKKQLLSTSAIALGVAFAAPASAQEWNMKWGGFYNSHVGYVSVDSNTPAHVGADFDGIDVYANTEIHFKPSVTLDNGLTFGVDVQMEGTNNGGGATGIDETYLSISGDTLGRIDLGNENSAGYKMSVGAPQVKGGIGINSPSISGFVPISNGAGGNLPWLFRDSGISSYAEVLGNNDVPRITYYTPSFNGLTLGVSYAASSNVAGGGANAGNNFGVNRNVGVNDIFDIGVAYSQSFNGIDLDLAARWGTAEGNTAGNDDPEVWNVGFNVGFNGFVIGGGYGENDNGGYRAFDSEGWSLGVTYDIAGPWSIGFDTYQGTYEGIGAASADEAEYEAYQLVGSRSLGAGVTWAVYAAYVQGTVNADLGGTFGNANTETEGTLIGTSINLSF